MSASELEQTSGPPFVDVPDPQQAPEGRRRTLPPSRLILPALTLVLVGLSLALFCRLLALDPGTRQEFLTSNTLKAAARAGILRWALAGVALPLVGIVAAVLARGDRAIVRVEALGDVCAPLMLVCFLPIIFSVGFSHANPLLYLLVLGAFGLLAQPLLCRTAVTLQRMPAPTIIEAMGHRLRALRHPSPRVFWMALVVVAAAGYTAYFSFYSIRNHHRLATTAFDLGIYDNLMFNAIHGHPFRATVLFPLTDGGNNLASHAEFGVLWFIPFYLLHPGPQLMLIAQSMLLGFAAVPLYLFARTQVSRPMAAVIALAYLCFPPLHGPNFYDFHWLTLAPFFQFWLFWAIATRRKVLTVVMILMLFSLREDLAVDLAGLGLFLLLTGIRPRLGLCLTVASVTWFAIDRFVIMPLAGSWYFQNLYSGLFADGVSSFGSVIKTILTNPLFFITTLMTQAKLEYVLHMLVPLAFLPLRRFSLVLLLLPAIFFTIMTTGYSPTIAISFQYTTHWTPFVFLASVLALVVLARRSDGRAARWAAVATVVVVLGADSYTYGAIFQHETFVGGFGRIQFEMTPLEERRWKGMKELVSMIPPGASVAATENETPHISTRKNAYPLRVVPVPVDYILVGKSHIGDLSRAFLNAALAKPDEYGLLAERDDELYLFKRGYYSPATAAATMAARRALGVP